MCHRWPRICSVCCSQNPVLLSSLTDIAEFSTRVIRQLPQRGGGWKEMLTLPGHLRSHPFQWDSGWLVVRFLRSVLSTKLFLFFRQKNGLYFSNYAFWLSNWDLRTFLVKRDNFTNIYFCHYRFTRLFWGFFFMFSKDMVKGRNIGHCHDDV